MVTVACDEIIQLESGNIFYRFLSHKFTMFIIEKKNSHKWAFMRRPHFLSKYSIFHTFLNKGTSSGVMFTNKHKKLVE